ncbi:MAG: xanthine dehydrogenase molybdopterin binding subunit [Candidatus Schekmanbacteria bacterium]|nr:xanthine dehydrogenase molybdopterin binding subunit [Candidatus Schekmanbacteria bacterium]
MKLPSPDDGALLHRPSPHESGRRHVTGEALYVDDFPLPPGTLVAAVGLSPHAHARIRHRDGAAALSVPGIRAVFFAADVRGDNCIGPIVHDEPLLAEETVNCVGQVVALVAGESSTACRAGIAALQIAYDPLAPRLSIEDAHAASDFIGPYHLINRGDFAEGYRRATHRIEGTLHTPPQEHFYLETQVALAIPLEDGAMHIHSSTQHPTEVQHMVARVLGIGYHRVVCEVNRIGGGFGGKESQATQVAALAALAARATNRPVKLWLDRDTDMAITGKRHPFRADYRAGFDADGHLLALDVVLYADAGWTTDLSPAILDRALFHLDGAYFVPAARFTGRLCRTNLPSNTAFRGFGGPQGMLVIDTILNRAAERLQMDPAEVRRRNAYADAPRNRTPYDQEVRYNRLPRLFDELLPAARYAGRRQAIEAFNAGSTYVKRGIGFQPVKFGISFTKSMLNQAGAYVLVFTDGTVQVNHAGTEMGQGLHTKILAICSAELGVATGAIRIMSTSTEKVPNTSPTAASSGSDLNGQAVQSACTTLRHRLIPIAAAMLGVEETDELTFASGLVSLAADPARSRTFAEVANAAWMARIPLAATGYYATPGIHFDPATGTGEPFYYFAFGGAVAEVEVCSLTGQYRVTRVDILHDAGNSLVPSIDRGQIEGGFIQGLGWLTTEDLRRDPAGRLITRGPSTYKIPSFGDAPTEFFVRLLDRAAQPGVIHGSKAVGEPPFMLAISVITALRHSMRACGDSGSGVELSLPATPESVLRAITRQRS